jgi:dolichol-phosphate mannosyltransferase
MPAGSSSIASDARTIVGTSEGVRSSIILATLNERSNLPELIDRIDRLALPASEVIVVDDGSVDGTREFVASLAINDPRIRLLRHEGKQTTLRAQCQGIEAARGKLLVIMDADLQHPPELVPTMLAALDRGSVLAIASRYVVGGSAGPRTVYRWVISRGAEVLTKILLPPARGIADPVSGYFGFRREIWTPLNPLYRGYKLLLFLLVMAEGGSVREVGFEFTPRTEGTSKVANGLAFVRVFATELILARRFRARLRPLHSATGDVGGSSVRQSLPH